MTLKEWLRIYYPLMEFGSVNIPFIVIDASNSNQLFRGTLWELTNSIENDGIRKMEVVDSDGSICCKFQKIYVK